MPSLPTKRLAHLLALAAALAAPLLGHAVPLDVVMYHNDPTVKGRYPFETILKPSNVNPSTFGKNFASAVDGQVYAQPLYAAGVFININSVGRHNVVFVATEHDSVYAFDADTGAQLWKHSFLGTSNGVTISSVPYTDLPGKCGQIQPELGITATPVLDLASGTLYVEAMTKEVSTATGTTAYYQRLHALAIAGGADKANSPVTVEAAVPGTADGGTVVTFVPLDYKERPALVLVNGIVYTSWSSHCDIQPYHGWVMGYNATTLKQVTVYNVTANGTEASFWDGGAAPAVDDAGNLFIGAGNGTFDVQNADGSPNPAGVDIGESYLRLSTTGNRLAPADWFTPFNKDTLNDQDLDTGSAGIILYDVGANHLAASAGKEGRIYILNRDNLGHFSPNADTGAVQTVPPGADGIAAGLFGCPAYFDSAVNGPTLYFSSRQDNARAFVLDPATGKLTGPATSITPEVFGYPGTTPGISAEGRKDGIAWMLEASAILHAYDADNLGTELYNTSQAANGRDALGSYVKFTTPTIAQGRVYAGTNTQLVAYGLLAPAKAVNVTAQMDIATTSVDTTPQTVKQHVTLTNKGKTTLVGPVSLVVDGLGSNYSLADAIGSTSQTMPHGSVYVNAVPPGGTLAPNASAEVTLGYVTTLQKTPPTATLRVLSGTGVR